MVAGGNSRAHVHEMRVTPRTAAGRPLTPKPLRAVKTDGAPVFAELRQLLQLSRLPPLREFRDCHASVALRSNAEPSPTLQAMDAAPHLLEITPPSREGGPPVKLALGVMLFP